MAILSQLLQRLCDADVDFVVIGGFAALMHGSTLVTRDLDICAVLSHEDVAKLREALRDLNPTHRLTPQKLSFLTNPDVGVPVQNLYLETEIGGYRRPAAFPGGSGGGRLRRVDSCLPPIAVSDHPA